MSDATDRLEITELLNRHQIYIDLADAERYAGLYAPDGAYESPFASATGRTDIAKMFRSLGASGFTTNKRHFTGPGMIDVEQGRATALSYWWVADYANDHPTVFDRCRAVRLSSGSIHLESQGTRSFAARSSFSARVDIRPA
jgi:hypothetical protein